MSTAQNDLCIGNIVHLNSGSPDLKIVELTDSRVKVEWHDELGSLEQASFPSACVFKIGSAVFDKPSQ